MINKNLVSIHYMPGTILNSVTLGIKKAGRDLCPHEGYTLAGAGRDWQTKNRLTYIVCLMGMSTVERVNYGRWVENAGVQGSNFK